MERTQHACEPTARFIAHLPQRAPFVHGSVKLTQRWTHPAFIGFVPAMPELVVGTLCAAQADIRGRLDEQRTTAVVRVGTLTVIPPQHQAYWQIPRAIDVSHVSLTQARLEACAEQTGRTAQLELIPRIGCDDPTSTRIVDLLNHELTSGDRTSGLFVDQAVDLLCIQLIRRHGAGGVRTFQRPRRGLPAWQVKRVTAYMCEHLAEDVRLDDLAKLVRLSRFHFCTSFRLATGRTPHVWLNAQRIAHARRLLSDPERRVSDVATSVGFQTPSSFSASFRRLVGVTPTEYRRKL
jgi:AraC family transcriptional regulator